MKISVAFENQPKYNDPMMITYLLRLYRKERKVTVRSLAKEIGIKHTTLWKFENGRDIESPSLMRIINWILTSKVL